MSDDEPTVWQEADQCAVCGADDHSHRLDFLPSGWNVFIETQTSFYPVAGIAVLDLCEECHRRATDLQRHEHSIDFDQTGPEDATSEIEREVLEFLSRIDGDQVTNIQR